MRFFRFSFYASLLLMFAECPPGDDIGLTMAAMGLVGVAYESQRAIFRFLEKS